VWRSRAVAPHLVPAMTETYATGQPVAFGPVRVGHEAITAAAGPPVPWRRIRLIRLAHVPKSDATAPVHKIEVYGTAGSIAAEIDISG
jgi:hypothetical protein